MNLPRDDLSPYVMPSAGPEAWYPGRERAGSKRCWPLIPLGSFSLHRTLRHSAIIWARMKAKLYPKAATMATTHKVAVIVCSMVKKPSRILRNHLGHQRDTRTKKRLEANIKRQAKQLVLRTGSPPTQGCITSARDSRACNDYRNIS